MAMLVDHELEALVSATPSLVTPIHRLGEKTADSSIQAASINLTIGEIFLPNAEPKAVGGTESPRSDLCLSQGETVLIRTAETIHMPNNLGGVAFAPSRVSLKGLLVASIGHIDPGYSGKLHLTVINMGKENFSLRHGDEILRVMFFQLTSNPEKTYEDRNPKPKQVITPHLVKKLSSDFLDVEARATAIARNYVAKAALGVPVIVIVVGGIIAFISNSIFNSDLNKISERVTSIEAKSTLNEATARITAIEARFKQIEDALAQQTKPTPR